MVGNFNPAINVIVIALLSMAPHLIGHVNLKGADAASFRKMYAQAQKEAQHIVETGDTSALAGASKELDGLDIPEMKPLLAQLAAQEPPDTATDMPVNY